MFGFNIYRRLTAVLVSVMTVFAGFSAAFALSPSSTPVLRGIDVSEWQGKINFDEVRSSGIRVIYIRACYGGSYTDPYFHRNALGAAGAGLKFGCYHYITARTTEEARQQAQYFASVIRNETYSCRPAMDFESFGSLNTREINAIAAAYLKELRSLTGVTPVIYSDANDAKEIFSESLNRYPLWVSDWGVEDPANNGKWKSWSGFQYGSGKIPGISTVVDLDLFTTEIFLPEQPVSSASSSPSPASETSEHSFSSDPLHSSISSQQSEISSSSHAEPGGSVWIPILSIAALLVLLIGVILFMRTEKE